MTSTITIARRRCPKCGRADVPIRSNFTMYQHRDDKRFGYKCIGPGPEVLTTFLLRDEGLDVRPDARDGLFDESDWVQKQTQRNRETEQRRRERQEARKWQTN